MTAVFLYFAVNYFIHAHTLGPDDTMRVVDPSEWTESDNRVSCVNVYVFDAQQELEECCSCPITPAGRLNFSLNKNLTQAPVTGGVLTTGTIKIVRTNLVDGITFTSGAAPAPIAPICNPGRRGGLAVLGTVASDSLFAWITHDVNQFNSDQNAVEEAEFQSTREPGSDLTVLQDKCETTLNTGQAHGTGACTCPAPVIP